jgi:hypothetical protein
MKNRDRDKDANCELCMEKGALTAKRSLFKTSEVPDAKANKINKLLSVLCGYKSIRYSGD